MRLLILTALLCVPFSAHAEENAVSKFFDNLIPDNGAFMKEWSSSHWKGQDFRSTIDPQASIMRLSVNSADSMFANSGAITPAEFIENLKSARIISRVYNPEFGFIWDRQVSDEVVIELDHNFYTLSYADKMVVTDMLSRSYQRDHYELKDEETGKTVGQITPEGFHLF